jgi:hypothetical protein
MRTMTFREIAAAFQALADAGVDPIGFAPVSALMDAVLARLSTITIDSDPDAIYGAMELIEALEERLHQLAAEHRAVSEINTVADVA